MPTVNENIVEALQFEDDFIPGEEIELKITLFASPHHFFFILSNFEDDLDALQDNMTQFYSEPELQNTIAPVVNHYYAAPDNDGVWQRVQVTAGAVGPDEDKVVVRWCDGGQADVLPISALQHLEPAFTALPRLANFGKLAGPLLDGNGTTAALLNAFVDGRPLIGKVVSSAPSPILNKATSLEIHCEETEVNLRDLWNSAAATVNDDDNEDGDDYDYD